MLVFFCNRSEEVPRGSWKNMTISFQHIHIFTNWDNLYLHSVIALMCKKKVSISDDWHELHMDIIERCRIGNFSLLKCVALLHMSWYWSNSVPHAWDHFLTLPCLRHNHCVGTVSDDVTCWRCWRNCVRYKHSLPVEKNSSWEHGIRVPCHVRWSKWFHHFIDRFWHDNVIAGANNVMTLPLGDIDVVTSLLVNSWYRPVVYTDNCQQWCYHTDTYPDRL